MKNRNLGAIIIFGVVVVGIVLAFMFQTRSNVKTNEPLIQNVTHPTEAVKIIDTSSWKLYRNKKFGYEMKYPPDWEITTLGNAPAESFSAPSFSPASFTDKVKIRPDLMIENIGKISKNETLETNMPLGAGSDFKLIDKKFMKVDGRDALLVEYFQTSYGRKNGKMGMVRQEIKVINGDISYLISMDEENEDIAILDSSKLWTNTAIFESMVGSFKFLDKK